MIFKNAVFPVTGSEDHSEAEEPSEEGKHTEIKGQPEEFEQPWEEKQEIDENTDSFTAKEPGLTGHDANV